MDVPPRDHDRCRQFACQPITCNFARTRFDPLMRDHYIAVRQRLTALKSISPLHPSSMPTSIQLRCCAILFVLALLPSATTSPCVASDQDLSKASALLNKHCLECHGPDLQEGNLRIDKLNTDLVAGDDADRWHEVLNRINVGEMPPEDEPQLSADELQTVTGWLNAELKRAAKARQANRGVAQIRRLNRSEYGNTMRDLFGMPLNFEKPLPPDGLSAAGFLNDSETLTVSPLHMDYYLKIGQHAVDKAVPLTAAPKRTAFRLEVGQKDPAGVDKNGKKKPATLRVDATRLDSEDPKNARRPSVSVSFGRRSDRGEASEQGAILSPSLRARGTGIPGRQVPNPSLVFRLQEFPTEGPVRIRVTAGAVDPDEPIKPQVRVFIGTLLDDGTEFAYLGPAQLITDTAKQQGIYEFHGQMEDLPLPFRQRSSGQRGDLSVMMIGVTNTVDVEAKQERTPKLLVTRVDFEAPFHQQWPPRSYDQVFFRGKATPGQESQYARQIFERFMTRAWRRPVRKQEVDRVHTAWQSTWQTEVVDLIGQTEEEETPVPGKPGLETLYFETAPADASLETYASMQPVATDVTHSIDLNVPVRKRADRYGLQFRGILNVPNDGSWQFDLASDDGSRLYIDGQLVIDNDGNHGMVTKTGGVDLSAGAHHFLLNYYNTTGGSGLKLQWNGPGIQSSPIAAEYFSHGGSMPLAGAPKPTFESTIKQFLPVVLASPNFLYLQRPESNDDAHHDFAIASRLSYFLWGTMPDTQLLELAAKEQLSNRDVLVKQVRRMLADPRSKTMVKLFVDQWLDLDGVQRVALNKDRFKDFWDETKVAMQQETRLLFAELMHNDLSALNLIDCDFTMLNDHLAQHYQIPGVHGPEFRRVALSTNDQRGGLLTHGSVLYRGSDGKDSHPIRRGVWLLKRLLDDPPPDPPPNVPDLDQTDPKLSGRPLKKQLELHRENQACANCHQKIDPFGIAFEDYSAVGRWRGEKDKTAANTTLPDGSEITSLKDLKSHLIEHRKQDFARALTKNLLTYALGRSLDFSDDPLVDLLSADLQDHDFQIRWLIEAIVTSDAFLQ